MFQTPFARFRAIGVLEAVSFLVLLGIAMPLKYFAGMPLAVRAVGWAHGLLFIAYLIVLVDVAIHHRWSLPRVGLAVIAALLPAGPFFFDAWLRREALESRPSSN